MNEQQLYVLNQYYIDFLKKIKGAAKDFKDISKEARDILRAIKKYYASMDKLSTEYYNFMKDEKFWEAYRELENKKEYSDSFLKKQLYEGIYIYQIKRIFEENGLLEYYLALMDIYMDEDIPVEKVTEIIKKLGSKDEFEEILKGIENENLVTKLKTLQSQHVSQTRTKMDENLKDIENTTLGNLAKEIMKDINVAELQNSIANADGNIFSSLQDPNSGIGKVINTVSQTMISKLASGELQQDKLLQDAMSLATKLPGMMPGGMGSQLGGIGAMLQQFQQMGGLNMNGAQKNAAGGRMDSANRKEKAKERLKKKLDKRE